jgi:PEP-CTERM motif
LANGSFEQGIGGIGSFSGWQTRFGDDATFVDSSGQTGTHPGQASDGLWSAYFGSTSSSGGSSIAQAIATVVGQTYVLSFDLANDNGGAGALNGFTASAGGDVLHTFAALGVQDYLHEQFSFTATSTSTLLSFAGYNDNGYLQLDKVAVAAAVPAVPEPSSVLLMLGGFAAAGLKLEKRRLRARG